MPPRFDAISIPSLNVRLLLAIAAVRMPNECPDKISGKKLKGSTISQGSGNADDVFEQLINGLMQLSGTPEVVESPDGSVKVIMKVKPSQESGD